MPYKCDDDGFFSDCRSDHSVNYFSAGGDTTGGETGFLGCMRNLYIQGVQITDVPAGANFGGVVNGSCSLQDRSNIITLLHHIACGLSFVNVFWEAVCI